MVCRSDRPHFLRAPSTAPGGGSEPQFIPVLCAQAPAAPRQISDQLREIGRGSAAPRLPAGRRAASNLTTIGGRRRAEPFAKRAMKGAGLRETQIACDVGHAPPTARELLLGEATQQLVADRT